MVGRPRSVPSSNPEPTTETGRITVPHLNRDPIQSMRPWPVVVTCCGRDIEIPALAAVDWLAVLMLEEPQLDDIFPGLLEPEDADWVEEQILSGKLGLEEFKDLIFDVIETVSARKWWVALRLIDLARRSWDAIGSEMILRGVDASTISLSGWLDVLLVTVLKNMESKDVTMFTLQLEAPPETEEEEPEELEMSRSAFMALGGQ